MLYLPSPRGSGNSSLLLALPPPATASNPQGPGDDARGCGESEDSRGRVPLDSGGCALQLGGLCGVPGRGTQDSGKGPSAVCDGESRPESSTFSGDEEEKGEGLEVKPRLLEPGGTRDSQLQTPPTGSWGPLPAGHTRSGKAHPHSKPGPTPPP